MRPGLFFHVVLAVLPLHAAVIGTDDFSYADGELAGVTGGTGFDRDFFDGEVTGTTADWDALFGTPLVQAGKLVTDNAGTKREFNGPLEGVGGGGNDGQNNHERSGAIRGAGRVFFRFDLTRTAGGAWSGASSYDFDTERLFFGVMGTNNPTSGNPEYGCEITGADVRYFSGIAADSTPRSFVAVVDFDHDFIGLWIDPDGVDFYNDATGANSCDAGGSYTGSNWSTAVRLGSGTRCEWDNLEVATSWSDFEFIDSDLDDDGLPDAWETANGLVVGVNDAALDPDGDGLPNLAEFFAGTQPGNGDTDGDGHGDGVEVAVGTNPSSSGSYPGVTHPPGLVGVDDFDGGDGPIAGRTGGIYWDADNSTENGEFVGHGGTPSDWDALFGSPQVAGGVLVTQESGAKREYNGPTEGVQAGSAERAGAVNQDGVFGNHVIYYKFEMTREAGATWSGASTYDFGAERYLFGVPGAANPATGNREFAIHNLDADEWAYSGIAPVSGVKYTLVAKLDFDGDVAALYLDPDLSLVESGKVPVAVYPHTSDNWSSAIRLASGGAGSVAWDRLCVAYTWEDLAVASPVAHGDSLSMHHLGKARIRVLENDTGLLSPGTLAILTPPAHGTATARADGTILYTHTDGAPTADSFSYSIRGAGGSAAASATVTVNFAAQARFDSDFVTMPETPPAGALQIVEAFPGITFDSPHGFCGVPGNAKMLFVVEADGRVQLIPDMSAPTKVQVLDLSSSVQNDGNERACKGIAVHPDWQQNGYIYLTYNTPVGVRLSRFTCATTAPYASSPASEVVLIEQDSDGDFHSISTCDFGPDGYLYVGFGDEGTQEDGLNNSQHVDRNLWSCVIRIDVDKRPGSLEPNPDPGPDADPAGNDADLVIPRTAGLAHYSIPADNPFVGATSFNGVTIDPEKVRTEIFVCGLRNPWQFSAEDPDADGTVDELWVADVGRAAREEITALIPGGNGGWGWREGTATGARSGDLLNGAAESAASLTAPLWDYGRGGGAFEGSSITGGFIYRGASLPELAGKYLCADYVSGNVWSLERISGGAPVVTRLGGEVAIVGMMDDPAGHGVLLLDRGNNGTNPGQGSIKRLVAGTDDRLLPPTLAATNFFADLTDLTPNPGGQSYAPNLRFWSDHAEKKRWFLIRNTTDTVAYSAEDPWGFPAGMIWVKHFDYPVAWESFTREIGGQTFTDRRPAEGSPRRRLETRFLIRNETGSYGISYRWLTAAGGSLPDGVLVGDDGESVPVGITLDGAPASVSWDIPSRAACMTCHTPEAGHALSFNTRQLNLQGSIAGMSGNQLEALRTAGYLSGFSGGAEAMPRHHRPDESSVSLEDRVRSYLAVNCAYCHQSGGTGGGTWDGRAQLPLLATGLLHGRTVEAPLHPSDRLVVAGDIPRSILYNRIAGANGYSRMPPLATDVPDLEAAGMLAAWIANEVHPYGNYDEWREARFGSLTSAQGGLAGNPEGDALDNFGEWAFGTDPAVVDDFRATPQLLVARPEAGVFRFTHRRLRMHAAAGIHYRYRTSDDLITWVDADGVEEGAVPSASDPAYETVTVSIPADSLPGPARLFVKVEALP